MVLSFCFILSPSMCLFGSEEPQLELRGECLGAEVWFQVKCCLPGQGTFLGDSLSSDASSPAAPCLGSEMNSLFPSRGLCWPMCSEQDGEGLGMTGLAPLSCSAVTADPRVPKPGST